MASRSNKARSNKAIGAHCSHGYALWLLMSENAVPRTVREVNANANIPQTCIKLSLKANFGRVALACGINDNKTTARNSRIVHLLAENIDVALV